METYSILTLPTKTFDANVNKVIVYIWKNYWMILDLVEAAELVQLTPQHLSSLFKKVTGLTFTNYCNALRINRGAWLLLHTDMTVKEITHAVGYESVHYFIACFKKATKKTPMQFRKEALANTEKNRNQSTE